MRLIVITPALVDALADADRFAGLTGARLGGHADLVREVVAQNEAHRARTGAPPEWGGHLAVDDGRGEVVGTCAFVGAPDAEGRVEIAYFTFPANEGQGYGARMAGALVERAAASGAVRTLVAHTLQTENASTRILSRLGFAHVGTAEDPDEGTVWRWERRVGPDAS